MTSTAAIQVTLNKDFYQIDDWSIELFKSLIWQTYKFLCVKLLFSSTYLSNNNKNRCFLQGKSIIWSWLTAKKVPAHSAEFYIVSVIYSEKIKPMPSSIPCNELGQLPTFDGWFRKRFITMDAHKLLLISLLHLCENISSVFQVSKT